MIDPPSPFFTATAWVLPVLLAITLHEAAHAYTAHFRGDDTAYRQGRVSLNPLRHVDPFGTVVLPGVLLATGSPFLFGYARPVPVNQHALADPRRDMVLVAAAGPAANVVLAIIAFLLLGPLHDVPGDAIGWIVANLQRALVFNLSLAIFNLLPIPPLDGAHIAIGLLPPRLSRPLESAMPYGMLVVFGLVVVLPSIGNAIGIDLNVIGNLVMQVSHAILDAIGTLADAFDPSAA